VKAGSNLEKTADSAMNFHIAEGGFCDTAQDLEQGTLAGPIAPDNAQHIPAPQFKRYILECPNTPLLLGSITIPEHPTERRPHEVTELFSERDILPARISKPIFLAQPDYLDREITH
jgi:hypothetical protein